jgi:polysaccharide chain length determinant protein (PEP-CTERM system associated)
MDELVKQVSTILRGMWKYRYLGVAVSWLVALGGATFIFTMQDRYEASARVYVDTQTILRPLMAGLTVPPNLDQQVALLSRTLISRPTVEKLVRMADLDLAVKTKAEREDLISYVTKTIQISAAGRDNLFTLSYRDVKPERAQKVVQSLLTIFVESSLGASKNDSANARRFIDEQIKTYEAKLAEAEARLKEFKLRNIDLQSKGDVDVAGTIAENTHALRQARLELREAESARDAARHQLDLMQGRGGGGEGVAAIPVATPELDARLDSLKRNLDMLLQRFTEQHPDVVGIRRLIKEIEEQRTREIAERRRAAASANASEIMPRDANPALLELRRTLSAAEVQVAALRARVSEYEARAGRARQQLKIAPQIEAELAQLNRDYDIYKSNYQALVSRRESANLAGELENAPSFADFRVIDPPRAGNSPVAPNRVLLLPVALIAALGAGLGISFLLSQLRPVFFEAAALRGATELPLLGVVSLVSSEVVLRQERRSLRRFLAAVLLLVAVFGVGMGVLSYRTGLLG